MAIAVGAEVVAEHRRVFCRGAKVLDALHVLPLLERKHRAVAEATALLDWRLAPVWQRARAELAKHTRKPEGGPRIDTSPQGITVVDLDPRRAARVVNAEHGEPVLLPESLVRKPYVGSACA